mmetsp:Transcript_4572/g.8598  ORF Transcript_4572/g.8598 Transcript_4572/m.8598 type:complete len:549 (-) Transcript_4572:279-1925(-)
MWIPQKKEKPKEKVIPGHNLEDALGPQVDIVSSWRENAKASDADQQTEPIPTVNSSCQSRSVNAVEVQTDDGVFLQMSSGVADTDISPFLEAVMPLMSEYLSANDVSTAFEESDAMADNTQNTVDEVHTLSMFDHNYQDLNSQEEINPHHLVCTHTSWNSTGYVLGVAYGRYDVSGWTDAPGAMCTWNLGRKEISSTKPDVTIEVDNPVQCISFHPSHPALIAGGTFNGELYVWDLSREDPLRGRSRITDLSHREPVTQVVWHFNAAEASKHSAKENAYQVITLSSDGRVMVWNWQKLDHPVYAYELVHPHPKTQRRVLWGGSALSFHTHTALAEDRTASMLSVNQGAFVVGTDGGTVYRCMFHHSTQMEAEFIRTVSENGKPNLRSPIKAEFSGHSGPVHGVDCSPFQRNVFCSCGIDGTIRIYNTLQADALTKLEPASVYLYKAQWSPFRPLVLAASTGDGRIAVYDFLHSKLHPARMIDVCGKSEPVYNFSFNPHLREYLAATSADTVKVFEVGESFSEPRGSEQRLLNQLADADSSSDAIFNQS